VPVWFADPFASVTFHSVEHIYLRCYAHYRADGHAAFHAGWRVGLRLLPRLLPLLLDVLHRLFGSPALAVYAIYLPPTGCPTRHRTCRSTHGLLPFHELRAAATRLATGRLVGYRRAAHVPRDSSPSTCYSFTFCPVWMLLVLTTPSHADMPLTRNTMPRTTHR